MNVASPKALILLIRMPEPISMPISIVQIWKAIFSIPKKKRIVCPRNRNGIWLQKLIGMSLMPGLLKIQNTSCMKFAHDQMMSQKFVILLEMLWSG